MIDETTESEMSEELSEFEDSEALKRAERARRLAPPSHDFVNAESATPLAPIAIPSRLPKVFVALCSRDWQVESHTAESVRQFGNRCKCEIEVKYMMNDGVARSRNNLVADAIAPGSDVTHILFLDNDIIPEPWHLDRLLAADKPLIGALYPKKQATLEWVMNTGEGSKIDAEGRMKVKHLGTGFWLLRVAELRQHIEKHPEIKYGGDPHPGAIRWDVFPMHAKDGRYLSEDWAFCERWNADGFEVWVDTKCQLRHIGKIVYPLQFTLSDEDMVDLAFHRYGIAHDLVRTFFASGTKPMGLMGGHREKPVRLWPADFKIPDLHQSDVLGGCYDFPGELDEEKAPTIIDLGADCGAFVRWAQKRWNGPTIHAYESRPDSLTMLQETAKGLHEAGSKATINVAALNEAFGELPKATILKIDLPGRERDVITAFQYANRLNEFEAIAIRYQDERAAFLLKVLLEQTHVCHCVQRITGDVGIMKFVRRDLTDIDAREEASKKKP